MTVTMNMVLEAQVFSVGPSKTSQEERVANKQDAASDRHHGDRDSCRLATLPTRSMGDRCPCHLE